MPTKDYIRARDKNQYHVPKKTCVVVSYLVVVEIADHRVPFFLPIVTIFYALPITSVNQVTYSANLITIMGFLKKFFSIGSKKSKRQELAHHDLESLASIPKHLQPTREEDAEAAVSRLLRSSSARFPVESGLNYASLPPLRK